MGLKNAKRSFWCKIALRLKKVGYKVSLCESCQRQSCKAFTVSPRAKKWLSWVVSYYLNIWPKLTNPPSKTPISNKYALVEPQRYHVAKSSITTNKKSTTSFPVIP